MDGGFQFLDIIFFALVAAFIILRLRSVLGKRTGHEQRPSDRMTPKPARAEREATEPAQSYGDDRDDNVVRLPGRNGQEIPAETPLGAGLTQIRVADPRFDPADFVDKAKSAFEYIVGAYAIGDDSKLKPLLSKDVFEDFSGAIRARVEEGHTLESTLVRIKDAELVEASMTGRTASVTVKYVTEQINVTRDADGKVIEGDPDRISEVTDIWTYERDIRSSNPNWVLVATETPS